MQTKQGWLRCGLLVAALGWCIGIQPVTAQFTLLHSFTGDDGAKPLGTPTLYGATLYGMTSYGGSSGTGTVFKINSDGTGFTILHNFAGGSGDGDDPQGSLTLSGSTLYGMTEGGGSFGGPDQAGGVVFSMNSDGTGYTILHNFIGQHVDGSNPHGSLTLSGATLYGMTQYGGSNDSGTVFKINSDGTEYTILHNFAGSDGANPWYGSLTLSGSTLYGMTWKGGSSGTGTVFKINNDGTGYTILHNFAGGSGDGASPYGSLTLSGATLYGMTSEGGISNAGVVFKINNDGTGYTILHNFTGGSGDGATPRGSLTLSGSTLYGMTFAGGSNGEGMVFQINSDGTGYTILHNFTGGSGDGAGPFGSLTLSGATLYGMTFAGGSNGYGAVFALALSTQIGPTIKANGTVGEITINYPETVSVTVEMNAGDYAGVPADWWVIALAGSSWYYLDNLMQWEWFDGNLSHCLPVYQGPLANLEPATVLNANLLPGLYTFWFAVDPADETLNVDGPILYSKVVVDIQ